MYVAKKFPRNDSLSAWVGLLPARQARPALSSAVTVDVAIIGAGFAGLSAARRLSQLDANLRVAVLEAGVVGEGATGRNSGFIIDLPHEVSAEDFGDTSTERARRDITLYRSAIGLATDMAEQYGWGREILDPCGRYSVAISAKGDAHIRTYAQQLKGLGSRTRSSMPRASTRSPAAGSIPRACTCPGRSWCSRRPISARLRTACGAR